MCKSRRADRDGNWRCPHAEEVAGKEMGGTQEQKSSQGWKWEVLKNRKWSGKQGMRCVKEGDGKSANLCVCVGARRGRPKKGPKGWSGEEEDRFAYGGWLGRWEDRPPP